MMPLPQPSPHCPVNRASITSLAISHTNNASGFQPSRATSALRRPPHLSEEQALDAVGPDTVFYAMRLRGASNAKAKRDLRFQPRPLEWLSS